MGVVLRTELKKFGALFILAMAILGFFYTGVSSVHAATIIRPPNNLGLVGYWSFDEGRGTQASDLSGNGNDGTLTGNPLWGMGKLRGGLQLDGSSRVNVPSFDLVATETVSAWVYPTQTQSSKIIGKHTNATDIQGTLGISNGRPTFEVTINTVYRNLLGPDALPLNSWSFVSGTFDGATIRLYVNGQEVQSVSQTGVPTTNGLSWSIGSLHGGTMAGALVGSIDEARIYNRALSESEVQSLYANTKSTTVGITPVDRYSNGLVGHWTFDGKHTTATTVEDVAGNNDGTIYGAIPARGIIGQAMEFDGVDDYIPISSFTYNSTETEITVATWFNTTASANNILASYDRNEYWRLEIGGNAAATNKIGMSFFTNGGQIDNFGSSTTVTDGEWHHVVFVFNNGTADLYVDGVKENTISSGTALGSGSTRYGFLGVGSEASSFDATKGPTDYHSGLLDDFRMYNKALTEEEILGLYSATKPSSMSSSTDELVTSGLAGHWSFDDGTINGTTVTDVSGSGNNGTLIGNTNQAAGKIREALLFDGDGDVVNTNIRPNEIDSTPVSFFAWVKIASGAAVDGRQKIFSGYAGGADRWDFEYISDKLRFAAYGAGVTAVGATTLNEDTWYHVGFVWTPGQDVKLYFNGAEDGSNAVSNSSLDVGVSFHIGGRAGLSEKEWEGLIDDVRIYNRALTEEEITQLYSMGQ